MRAKSDSRHPADHAEAGGWPDGPFKADAAPEVYLVAAVAQRLGKALEKVYLEPFATRCGLSSQTIRNVLQGRTWPDLRTIARLETALDKRLWGCEHRQQP